MGLAIIVFLILSIPTIEGRTWVLSYAQKTEAPFLVVAYGKNFAGSSVEAPLFSLSKQTEVVCEARNGRLLLTDQTNGKTYEGSYKIKSFGWGQSFKGVTYTVFIDGLEGTAQISSDFHRILLVDINGYCLNFGVE